MTEEEYKLLSTCIAVGIANNAAKDDVVRKLLDLKVKIFKAFQEKE